MPQWPKRCKQTIRAGTQTVSRKDWPPSSSLAYWMHQPSKCACTLEPHLALTTCPMVSPQVRTYLSGLCTLAYHQVCTWCCHGSDRGHCCSSRCLSLKAIPTHSEVKKLNAQNPAKFLPAVRSSGQQQLKPQQRATPAPASTTMLPGTHRSEKDMATYKFWRMETDTGAWH